MMESVSLHAEQAQDVLHAAVDRMMDSGVGFADARSQTVKVSGVSTINGGIRQLVEKSSAGVCLRAWSGGRWGYATVTSFDREGILRAADEAVRNSKGDSSGSLELDPSAVTGNHRAKVRIHPDSVDMSEKVDAVMDIDSAQAIDDRIINRSGAYSEEIKTNALVNSAGSDLSWEEVRTICRAMAVASDGQRMEQYYDGPDSTRGFEIVRDADLEEMGRTVAKEAIATLSADRPPCGNMTVISDPMVSGLLAHEAMGHASEGDEITKKRSFLTDAVGTTVASDIVSMYDDGSLFGAHGSIPFDDEGTPSSKVTIIDHGVYKGYMHSLETAALLNSRPTGNGRAENAGKRTWVRMTNTFFGPGEWDRDELVSDTRDGILCDKMLNGMEDPVGGCFEAKCLRGFLIRNGEIVKPLRSFTLTGRSIDILSSVDALSKEVVLDGGMCGKGIEDWVRVSTGGPYMRAKMIVGGGQ